MMSLCCDVLSALKGRTLVTAESCTGGSIGAALTAVPGSSEVYIGGIICYTNWVKQHLLDVDEELLTSEGAVSSTVAESMADGVRKRLHADVSVSVTGLAGPGADDFGNPVGTVYIGYSDKNLTISYKFQFEGSREEIRNQAVIESLKIILAYN